MAGVDPEPVGDVEQSVSRGRELPPLGEPERGPHIGLPSKRRTSGAEPAGHDQMVSGPSAGTTWNANRASERRDAEPYVACARYRCPRQRERYARPGANGDAFSEKPAPFGITAAARPPRSSEAMTY